MFRLIYDTAEEFNIPGPAVLLVLLGVILGVTWNVSPDIIGGALRFAASAAPVWIPIALGTLFWNLWVHYVRRRFIDRQEYVVLEVKVPKDIRKTPAAMEAVFSGLHIGVGETTFIDRNFLGKSRPWFSFEIASIGGQIHFYVWTRRFFAKAIESQIYAQYPGVEIAQVPDYTRGINFVLGKNGVWGCDYKLSKADPYPIKTYIDYGLDKPGTKEEEKTDPLASLLEFMGSIGPGEQLWIQILVRTHKKRRKPGTLFSKEDWKDAAKVEIQKIRTEASKRASEALQKATKKETPFAMLLLTRGEEEAITAIERSIAKQGFEAGIRGIYIADIQKFNPINIIGLVGAFKQFGSQNLNGFSPTRWLARYDYPWEDFRQIRQNRDRRRIIDAFRRRSWFFPPYRTPTFVLNTEELATIYHFPGETVATPTLPRIPSARAEAPPNLPV